MPRDARRPNPRRRKAESNERSEGRAPVAEAKSELERARQAHAALEAGIPEAENRLQFAKGNLDNAVQAVMQAETGAIVARILKDAQRMQADLVARRVVLRHLHRAGCVAEPLGAQVQTFLMANNVLPGTIGAIEYADFNAHPAAAPWHAAVEKLKTDADAPLPS